MGSKKRRRRTKEASETIPKKRKPSETAETSSVTSAVSTSVSPKWGDGNAPKNEIKTEEEVLENQLVATDGCPTKTTKQGSGSTTKFTVEVEDDAPPEQKEEDAPENNQSAIEGIPGWTRDDLQELMKRMECAIPAGDMSAFSKCLQKLDWDMVSFGSRTAQQCKETWMKIQACVRKFRLLKELIEDGKAFVAEPSTQFYGRRNQRHPDMPKRPPSSYILFYFDVENKVAKEHPNLKMTEIQKYINNMYKALPEEEKKKYKDMAASQRKEYDEKMIQFYQEHPSVTPVRGNNNSRSVLGPKGPLPHFKEELKSSMSQNPEFEPANVKNVSTKEKSLYERVPGKTELLPKSGYALFARFLLASGHIKHFTPQHRKMEICRMWKKLPRIQKKKYMELVKHVDLPQTLSSLESSTREKEPNLGRLPDVVIYDRLNSMMPSLKA